VLSVIATLKKLSSPLTIGTYPRKFSEPIVIIGNAAVDCRSLRSRPPIQTSSAAPRRRRSAGKRIGALHHDSDLPPGATQPHRYGQKLAFLLPDALRWCTSPSSRVPSRGERRRISIWSTLTSIRSIRAVRTARLRATDIGRAKQTRLAGIATGAPSDFDRHAPHVARPACARGRTDWWSGPETRRPSRSSRSCRGLPLPHHAMPARSPSPSRMLLRQLRREAHNGCLTSRRAAGL
jgi:hypothetical protein